MSNSFPDWTRDELILALDLYFKNPKITGNKKHPDVFELSGILRGLGIHDTTAVPASFRNEHSVYRKLCNFIRIDPSRSTEGLPHGSNEEEVVWNEFVNDQQRLHELAAAIRANVGPAAPQISTADAGLDDDDDYEAPEGKVLLRVHRRRERNRNIVEKKKAQVLKKTGRLACECCDFDFYETYGDLGEGFIEAHHGQPLSTLRPGQVTKLSDLHLVCANCHRMLHRGPVGLTVENLHDLLALGRGQAAAVPAG